MKIKKSMLRKNIRQVWMNKASKQLLISIPKDLGIKEGDYVEIKKIKVTITVGE